MYGSRIIKDSMSPTGVRLTTMELTYPRFVHSEFMTHRMFSRNAASSRAIPITKMIEAVKNDPVMPVWWGKNQSGMQAKEELTGELLDAARTEWLTASKVAINSVMALNDIGLHKQIANRILEPWLWMTVVVTATEWSNFFALRCHPDAQPEIQRIAYRARDLYNDSIPLAVGYAGWHLPYIDREDVDAAAEFDLRNMNEILKKMSVARCARVSYTKQNEKKDVKADIDLHDRLAASGHWSPFEHVACPLFGTETYVLDDGKGNLWSGNFRGWGQYRKEFKNECQ